MTLPSDTDDVDRYLDAASKGARDGDLPARETALLLYHYAALVEYHADDHPRGRPPRFSEADDSPKTFPEPLPARW